MKHLISLCLLMGCLISCSTYQLPPFAHTGKWQLQENTVTNRADDIKIDFGAGNTMPITNASNGDYDLHFITSEVDFDHYDPICAQYIKDVLKDIPLKVDSIDFILADKYLVLTSNVINQWQPDYRRRADGAWIVSQAFPEEPKVQPHDQLWRNLVFNKKKHQITVVDRIIKNGKHYAIVYILQSETKGLPFANIVHYDIVDQHNIQAVGTYLEYLLGISVAAHNNKW